MTGTTLVEVKVGASLTAKAQFIVGPGVDTGTARAEWELQDWNGVLYNSGNAISLTEFVLTAQRKMVNAEATITIPASVPILRISDKYRIIWTMYDSKDNLLSTYSEAFSIRPATVHPFGVPDIVETFANRMRLVAVLPSVQTAQVTIFKGNNVLYSAPAVQVSPTPVYEGSLYELVVEDTYNLGIREQLAPYSVLWTYTDNVTGETISEDGYIYHVTPSILSAAKELQAVVNRVRNEARIEETTIDLNVCIHFLKMGADVFNATGMPTFYTYTNTQGPLRAFWIQASAVCLLRSQYLVEAERSFTMSGQSVQLDYDIKDAYEAMASSIQGWIDQYAPDFKKNVNRRGEIGGDGDQSSYRNGNVGASGVSLSPVSNFFWMRYPRYRGW